MAESTSTVSIIKVQIKRRKPSVFLSDAQRIELLALIKSGLNNNVIAARFGVCASYVSNARRTVAEPPPSLDGEEWRPVPGWEARCKVSNLGRVRHDFNESGGAVYRLLKPRRTDKGYRSVVFYAGGKPHSYTAHSLVAAAFIGPRPEGLEINHKDGDKANNRLENLEYVTPSGNARHARNTGLMVPLFGSAHGMAVFTEADVAYIKWQLTAGVNTGTLSRHFKTSTQQIARVRHNKTWRHVPWPQGPCDPLPLNPGSVLDDGRKRNAAGKYLPD